MFNDALFFSQGKPARRLTWLTLPLALFFHALLIASLVVVPLLRADASLPKTKVIGVSITAPPVPLPPSRGSGRKVKAGEKIPEKKKPGANTDQSNPPIPSGTLRAPIEVPATIEEDPIGTGFGDGPGDPGNGIPDGFEDGDPFALIAPKDGDKVDDTLPALRIANVQMPRKIREVKPVYSPVALAARVQGKVVIEAMTDVFGRVRSARIISSASPLLNDEALNAVKQWRYEPYIVNGIPKPVLFTVTITFTLTQ